MKTIMKNLLWLDQQLAVHHHHQFKCTLFVISFLILAQPGCCSRGAGDAAVPAPGSSLPRALKLGLHCHDPPPLSLPPCSEADLLLCLFCCQITGNATVVQNVLIWEIKLIIYLLSITFP